MKNLEGSIILYLIDNSMGSWLSAKIAFSIKFLLMSKLYDFIYC